MQNDALIVLAKPVAQLWIIDTSMGHKNLHMQISTTVCRRQAKKKMLS